MRLILLLGVPEFDAPIDSASGDELQLLAVVNAIYIGAVRDERTLKAPQRKVQPVDLVADPHCKDIARVWVIYEVTTKSGDPYLEVAAVLCVKLDVSICR